MNGKTKMVGLVTVLVGSSLLGGCSNLVPKDEVERQISEKESQVESLREKLYQTEQQLEFEQNRAEQLEESVSSQSLSSASAQQNALASLLPPEAKPGECYAKVLIPPTYRTETETVLEREAGERVETIPGRYSWTEKSVLVKEASERIETIPAQYDWVEEKVLVKPAITRLEVIPAQYKTVTEKVLEKQGQIAWKQGKGLYTKINGDTSIYSSAAKGILAQNSLTTMTSSSGRKVEHTGETICLVEEPPKYTTLTKTVLASPETTKEVVVTPAKYEIVRKKVVVTPATTRRIPVPAEYKTVRVQQEIEPPTTRRIPVPAKYKTIEKQIAVNDGGSEWRLVLCETNMTPDIVRQLQAALKREGAYSGPVDGVIGTVTMRAVDTYQRRNNLPRGGITMSVLKRLGISTTN
jgi:outer membrane murein-binding lipoprotein Lpp